MHGVSSRQFFDRMWSVLSVEELRSDVESGAIDTVVVAFTDMQGRLMGKRVQAEFFLEDSLEHGVEGCNYLLALEMEMDPVPGYEIASWERGYGDFRLAPTCGRCGGSPGSEGTALVLADVLWHDGSPVRPVPPAGAGRAGRACAGARLRADVRLRARVLPLQGDLRRGARRSTTAG